MINTLRKRITAYENRINFYKSTSTLFSKKPENKKIVTEISPDIPQNRAKTPNKKIDKDKNNRELAYLAMRALKIPL